ncbi:MAG: PadR family transcriptional regulator [Nocardioidaceae bacterium]
MSTPSAVLGLLQRGPRHGYDLKREHDLRFPMAKPLAYGQVYATLGRLERDGLVEVTEQQPGDGPDRTVYGLTDAGWARVEAWVREPEPPAPHVANVLYAKLVVALLGGRDGAGYLDTQRRAHLARMRELTRARRDDPASALAADYALFHLEADVRWLETTLARLHSLALEVHA